MQIKEKDLLAAYKNGCSDVKNTLKTLFPEVLEKVGIYKFNDTFIIFSGYSDNGDTPLTIGKETVPKDKRNKCLVLSEDYTLRVTKLGKETILEFIKK